MVSFRKVKIGAKKSHGKEPVFFSRKLRISVGEIQFKKLVENMNEAMWMGDQDERTVYANPKFCKLIGYRLNEILGRESYDFWTEESAKTVRHVNMTDRKAGISSSYEGDLLTKSGKTIPVLLSGTPLPDGGTIGIMTDLTEIKRKEQALRESEKKVREMAIRESQERYKTIFENTGTATIIIDENKKVILANSEFEKLSLYKKEQIENKKSWMDFFVKEDLPRLIKFHALRRIDPLQAPRNYETQFIDNKGGIHDVYMTVSMVPGTKNSVASLLDLTERKRAESLLKVSEEMYRSMIDQSMVGVCMFQGTKIAFANQKIADIFGYRSASEILGKDIRHFLETQSSHTARQLTLARQAGEELPELGEYIGIKRSGKRINLQTFSKRIVIGEQVYSQVLVIDATEKKSIEKKLAQHIKEFNVLYHVYAHTLMVRRLPLVFSNIVCDLVRAFQFMDIACSRIVFDGKEYHSCKKPVRFAHKIEEPLIIRGEKRGYLSVGYIKTPPSAGRNLFLPEERKIVQSVARMLMKHIHNREVMERYQKIVKKSVTGIYFTEKGILRYANRSFCKIFGYCEKNILGLSIRHFVVEGSCDDKLLKNPRCSSIHHEAKGKKKGGTLIDLDIVVQRLDYHGQPGTLGRVHDITQLKAAEQRLKHFNSELKRKVAEKTRHLESANKRLKSLNELKDEFIAITSHELRSPLTSIRGYLSFLMEKDVAERIPHDVRPFLSRAYHSSESLNHLVNNILDVSRLDTGRFEIQKACTDLLPIIRSTLETLTFQAHEKKLKIRLKNLSRHSKIMAEVDPVRIGQVIRNLLDNAIKFSRIGKEVLVEARLSKKQVTVKVIDQGVGIPKPKINLIFEKFMQIKDSDTRYKGGAGLGLFISRRIVELHGGKIAVESQKQKGAVFTVQLPAC